MKKTVTVAVGGRSFIMDEDAYNTLDAYLERFKAGLGDSRTTEFSPEVMEEVEMRIGDLFREGLKGREVVDLEMVKNVMTQMGMPEGSAPNKQETSADPQWQEMHAVKKFYRDPEGGKICGVCSGLAIWLNMDVTIVRILFVLACFLGTAGFWIYLILCIIAPAARSAVEKCELRGIPATAENIRKFSESKR